MRGTRKPVFLNTLKEKKRCKNNSAPYLDVEGHLTNRDRDKGTGVSCVLCLCLQHSSLPSQRKAIALYQGTQPKLWKRASPAQQKPNHPSWIEGIPFQTQQVPAAFGKKGNLSQSKPEQREHQERSLANPDLLRTQALHKSGSC